MRRFDVQAAIAALLLPLALNSVLLFVLVERWQRTCVQPLVLVKNQPFLPVAVCDPKTSVTVRLLMGLTFAELALHVLLGLLITVGTTSSSFAHPRTIGAALRVGSLLPFATVLPFTGPQVMDGIGTSMKGFDPHSWMVAWHLTHRALFWAVMVLHVIAAALWISNVSPSRRSQTARCP
jgi:hypothetical protein